MLSVGILLFVGAMEVYSASSHVALRLTGRTNFFFVRHCQAIVLGLAGLMVGFSLQIDRVLSIPKWMVFLGVACLLGVFVPGVGKSVYGSNRWIRFGLISFQASEIAKVFLLLYLSAILACKKDRMQSFIHGIFPPMLICLLFTFLVLIEPDVSTAILILSTSFFVFFLGGAPIVFLSFAMVMHVPMFLIVAGYHKYLIKRVASLVPWRDPQGAGYHVSLSLQSFQRGGFWGAGPGNASSKLASFPEAHTDFIFAVVGEEFGFVGVLLIMIAFGGIIWRGFAIATAQTEDARKLLAYGISCLIGLEVTMHTFVTLGLIPTTGAPLPFMSYGRSHILTHLFLIGIMLNLSRAQDYENRRKVA